MTMVFVCVVAIGTFVMAPAELGEPARVCVTLHWGADLAQREGGGGARLRLERQQHQHERQEKNLQREWRRGKKRTHRWLHWAPNLWNITTHEDLIRFAARKNKLAAQCLHNKQKHVQPNPVLHAIVCKRPPCPVLFAGSEVGAGRETRRDAVPPGNGQPSVSGEPSGQADGGGERQDLIQFGFCDLWQLF